MPNHDRYDNDILKQLTRIANILDKIEKRLPDASNLYFTENFLGELAIGYKKKEDNSLNSEPMKE